MSNLLHPTLNSEITEERLKQREREGKKQLFVYLLGKYILKSSPIINTILIGIFYTSLSSWNIANKTGYLGSVHHGVVLFYC